MNIVFRNFWQNILPLLFVLLMAVPALADEGRFYRATTVPRNYDDTYAMVEKLRANRHYGQSMQCVKYPGRGECAVYNSMANQNIFYVYIESLNDNDTRVAVYITSLADRRAKQEIDDFFKQLK